MTRIHEWSAVCEEEEGKGGSILRTSTMNVPGGALYRVTQEHWNVDDEDFVATTIAMCFVSSRDAADQANRMRDREEYAEWRDQKRAEEQAEEADRKSKATIFPGRSEKPNPEKQGGTR